MSNSLRFCRNGGSVRLCSSRSTFRGNAHNSDGDGGRGSDGFVVGANFAKRTY